MNLESLSQALSAALLPLPEPELEIGKTVLIVMVVIFGLLFLFLFLRFANLYLRSVTTQAGVGLLDMLFMSLRKVDPATIVNARVNLVQARVGGTIVRDLEAHYLAGGRIPRVVTALISVILGSLVGAAAGFFGGRVDSIVMYFVSTLSSIPYLVLLTVIAFMFTDTEFDNAERPALALVPIYVAFCSVFWISTCRVVRGEVFKIKELEYVQAATAVGFSRFYILVRHVIPNTAHLMFINFSLLFIGAIKSEVILSFLGLGVKGQPSWGIMINHGRDGVTSFFFWEVGAATAFMFVLVLAFNVVSDALQDAFDPKHVG